MLLRGADFSVVRHEQVCFSGNSELIYFVYYF